MWYGKVAERERNTGLSGVGTSPQGYLPGWVNLHALGWLAGFPVGKVVGKIEARRRRRCGRDNSMTMTAASPSPPGRVYRYTCPEPSAGTCAAQTCGAATCDHVPRLCALPQLPSDPNECHFFRYQEINHHPTPFSVGGTQRAHVCLLTLGSESILCYPS